MKIEKYYTVDVTNDDGDVSLRFTLSGKTVNVYRVTESPVCSGELVSEIDVWTYMYEPTSLDTIADDCSIYMEDYLSFAVPA